MAKAMLKDLKTIIITGWRIIFARLSRRIDSAFFSLPNQSPYSPDSFV